jgi:signal transduction histidine kinase
MSPHERRTRTLQVGFLILLGVCAAQVGWWVFDQWSEARRSGVRLEERLSEDLSAAERLVSAGMDPAQAADAFEYIKHVPGRGLVVDPAAREHLADETRSRIRRYSWEGAFFLAVLISAMTVLSRALREESVLRRRQQNFLAAVGHEFKSPLAGIQLAAETMAMRDPDTEHRRRLLQRILEEVDRLEGMVANLLDTARIEEGTDVLAPQPVDLAEAVRGVFRSLEERAALESATLQSEIGEGVSIYADRNAVTRVLRNLLDNALKAVRESALKQVRVKAHPGRGMIELEVTDTGSGFDPKESTLLFDKFYRPGNELRRGGRGSGLGLYIVRHLVESSGGTVRAHSEGPGRGATFTVSWPVAPARPGMESV